MTKLPLVYHPGYSPAFDPSHRFPMAKFHRLYEYLSAEIGQHCQFFTPVPATETQIRIAHDPDYISSFRHGELSAKAIRRIGLPWSEGVMQRTFLAVGGSLLTMELALQHGLAAHLAGGTHHAHGDCGSGFCIFNDLAICALTALSRADVERVMIIDVDVHQGDGTARILANTNNAITVSFHCKQNFPARKAASDHDIEFEHGTGDADYLAVIEQQLPYLLEIYNPDLVIYDAGADPHEDDALGLLKLSSAAIFARDYFVLRECRERAIPVSCVIGGGYMKDRQQLAKVHGIVHRAALKVWQETEKLTVG